MPARFRSSVCLPFLGLVVAMLLWGGSFIVMKIALRSYDPVVVMCGRMIVALLFFALFRKRFGRIEYRPGDWKLLGFMALCEPCLYFVLETHALLWTSATEAAMVTALLPVLTLLGARIFLSETIGGRNVAGLVVAFAGVLGLTLLGGTSEHAPCSWLGNTLELAAMVFAAAYTLTSRHLGSRYSPFFITAVQALAGSVFFTPALLLPWTRLPADWGWEPLAAVVYLGAGVNVLAYFLYNYGLSRIPVSQVSPLVNLIPVFSLILAWMVLGEALTPMQYVAAAVVLGGTMAGQGRLS